MKPFVATFMLMALVLLGSLLQTTMASSSFCDSKCALRCSKARLQDRCLKYCRIWEQGRMPLL
ncbi:hypothetical protein HanPI659440_Chr04g0148941 [Helianthus annuus]|nr:hypothetical protein HanPI659440_Chr04g0148941 [Helianthus annuus]